MLKSDDDDPELLLHVPFDGAVKLTGKAGPRRRGGSSNSSGSSSDSGVAPPGLHRSMRRGSTLARARTHARTLTCAPHTLFACLHTGITIIGGADGTSPARLRVFVNRDDLDFAGANELPPTQEWELLENLNGQIEYPTQ